MNYELENITRILFSHDALEVIDDTSDVLYDTLVEKAQSVINTYGWPAVFESWNAYMHDYCHTVKETLSFATWFEAYGGHTHKIPDPYSFLAYLYDKFDLCPVRYDAQIMDDISYGLLEAAGIKSGLWMDDDYTTETDPELIKAVEKLREDKQ